MFHYRSALDVIVSAAGAPWLMSAGSGSVPDTQPFLGAYLHDWRLINCLGYERESYYSVYPVIEGWPVRFVIVCRLVAGIGSRDPHGLDCWTEKSVKFISI